MNEKNTASWESASFAEPGERLRAVRERLGIEIDDLAGILKVSPERLEALETGNLHALPDLVFARALAASVCRVLQIDPAEVLARLPSVTTPRIGQDDSGPHSTLRDPSPSLWYLLRVYCMHPMGIGSLLAFVGIGIVLWLPPAPQRTVHTDLPAHVPMVKSEPIPWDGASAPLLAASIPTPAWTTASLPVLPASAHATVGAMGGSNTPTQTVSSAPALPPAMSSDTLTLELRAIDSSWVEVADSEGKQVLRRMLLAGESERISAKPPLSVLLGKANGVEVTVRGRRFDAAAHTQGNVARFEVR